MNRFTWSLHSARKARTHLISHKLVRGTQLPKAVGLFIASPIWVRETRNRTKALRTSTRPHAHPGAYSWAFCNIPPSACAQQTGLPPGNQPCQGTLQRKEGQPKATPKKQSFLPALVPICKMHSVLTELIHAGQCPGHIKCSVYISCCCYSPDRHPKRERQSAHPPPLPGAETSGSTMGFP